MSYYFDPTQLPGPERSEAMEIRRATSDDFGAVHRLLQNAPLLYKDYGREDLRDLLARGESTLVEEGGRLAGFLGIQVEERPSTLPPAAPTRASLRCVALGQHAEPRRLFPFMLEATERRIAAAHPPVQVISYGHEGWYVRALRRSGFTIVDRVRFFQLDRLSTRVHSMPDIEPVARIIAAQPDHLDSLAALDARSFPPLWHFGKKDMVELLMRCDVLVALVGEQVVGYAAISTNTRTEAQLARLAVDPGYQGHGIGKQLVDASIRHAVAGGFAVMVLNTQTDNDRSQHLYRSFEFRPVGLSIPVYAKTVCAVSPAS